MRKTLLLPFLLAAVAYGDESKTAGRVFLSSGDAAEVFCTRSANPAGATSTLTVRLSSGIVTVSAKDDYIRRHGDMRISDGKTVLEVHDDSGYYSDNLPVPLQVKIGDDVYRVLLKPNSITDDQKKMQAAIAKLPPRFLAALRQLVPIGGSAPCSMPALAYVSEMFDNLPKNRITTVENLSPEEVEALIRDAVK